MSDMPAARNARNRIRPLKTFPQADNINRVFAFVDAVAAGKDNWHALEDHMGLSYRAVFNYMHAARWLDLLKPDRAQHGRYLLSSTGARYAKITDPGKRAAFRRRQVLQSKVIRSLANCFDLEPEAFREQVLEALEPPGRNSNAAVHNSDTGITIEQLTDTFTRVGGTTGETSRRRAYAVRAWRKDV